MPITLGDLRLYSIDEIAEILKVTRRSLHNYVKAGRLTAHKFGKSTYITERSLIEYFNSPPKKTKRGKTAGEKGL